jgi:hypothetical protein
MTEETENKLFRTLGRMEQKLDTVLKSDEKQTKDIDSLKQWRSWMFGISAGVSAVIGMLAKFIAHK